MNRFGQAAFGCALLALAGCGAGASAVASDDWVSVGKGDLVLEVDVMGALQAARTTPVGPPSSAETWDFKITQMVTEGSEVKKGMPVLSFDTGELERELLERITERDAADKDIERKKHDIDLSRQDDALRITEAEAAARKAALKADLPVQYTSAVEMRLAKVDLEAADAELRMAKQRAEHNRKLGEAELAFLRERYVRAETRVEHIQKTLAAMSVKAPIGGVVVYRSSWRGEKKKVGDPCWVGEGCVEITDVKDLFAKGEVDEMESARVAVGQRARLRLDAFPETEWAGTIVELRPNVYRQSPRNPIKVIGVNIKLDKVDAGRMRPGMQFRGRLETGRVAGALLLPVNAVFSRMTGPIVFRKTATGFEKVRVELGRRSKTQVEVRSGVREGDEVARRDLEREEGTS